MPSPTPRRRKPEQSSASRRASRRAARRAGVVRRRPSHRPPGRQPARGESATTSRSSSVLSMPRGVSGSGWEHPAEVAQAGRAQQRVAERVQRDVAVRVTVEAWAHRGSRSRPAAAPSAVQGWLSLPMPVRRNAGCARRRFRSGSRSAGSVTLRLAPRRHCGPRRRLAPAARPRRRRPLSRQARRAPGGRADALGCLRRTSPLRSTVATIRSSSTRFSASATGSAGIAAPWSPRRRRPGSTSPGDTSGRAPSWTSTTRRRRGRGPGVRALRTRHAPSPRDAHAAQLATNRRRHEDHARSRGEHHGASTASSRRCGTTMTASSLSAAHPATRRRHHDRVRRRAPDEASALDAVHPASRLAGPASHQARVGRRRLRPVGNGWVSPRGIERRRWAKTIRPATVWRMQVTVTSRSCDVASTALDHDHRAVVEEGDALARLLALLMTLTRSSSRPGAPQGLTAFASELMFITRRPGARRPGSGCSRWSGSRHSRARASATSLASTWP